MIYDNGIDAFRDQQRQQAIERHERNLQFDREQKARTAAEAEAEKLPVHEEMKQKAAAAKVNMWKLTSGDVHATEKIRSAVIDAFTVMQYILETITPEEAAPEEG